MEGSRIMCGRVIWAGLLAGVFVVQPIQADETQSSAKSPADQSTPAAVADDPRLPPLPYQRLVELGSSRGYITPDSVGVAEALKVTPEQREKIGGIVAAGQRYDSAISTFRQQFETRFGGLQRRPLFIAALDKLHADNRAETRAAMTAVLTADQRAGLRQRFRLEAHEQRNVGQQSGVRPIDSARITACIQGNDKLSLLSLLSVQQTLEISDAQHLALLDLNEAAVDAACRILRPEIEAELSGGILSFPVAGAKPSPVAMDQVLTPDQMKKFEAYMKSLPPEKLPQLFGGTSIKTQEVNGQLSVEVKFGNPFENDPDLRKAVGLSDKELQLFKEALVRSEEKTRQLMLENHDRARNVATAAQTRLEAAEKPFLEEWNRRALAVLLPDQIARVDTLKWRGEPVLSLLDADLAQRLELTEEQSATIRKHLVENRPKPPELPPPGRVAGFDPFRKHDEAIRAQVVAFAAEQRAAVAVLTPAQLAKFVELTGYQPPRGHGFRPVGPAPKLGDDV